MITERTLRKWRKEALKERSTWEGSPTALEDIEYVKWTDMILKMTQELLDQHLLRREK